MEKLSNKIYMLKRMCPRGRIRFFFTVNEIQLASETLPSLIMEDPLIRVLEFLKLSVISCASKYTTAEGNAEVKHELMVYEVNYIDVDSELDVIDEATFSPLVASIPRRKELTILTLRKPDIVWSIEDSAFSETRQDDEVPLSP